MGRRNKSLETRPDGSRISLESDRPDSLQAVAAVLPRGTLLRDGRLRIEKRIGRGAMGEVYVAFDLERGERVALKLLLDPSGEAIYRIKLEFRSVAELIHDNLVRLHELFEDQGRWFFTMELVVGRHLISAASEEQPTVSHPDSLRPPSTPLQIPAPPRLPRDWSGERTGVSSVDVTEVRRSFRELARGIIKIHDSGQLHRDLKPTNVLVTETGRVVILDFGLMTNLEEQQQARADLGLSGTPAYMAPEVIAGEAPTEACDWYAFGVMLYETLAGRLPFEGTVTSVMTSKQRWSALPPAQVRGEELDPELEELCISLLRRDPKARAGREQIEQVLSVVEEDRASLPIDARMLSLRPGFFGREKELARLEQYTAQVADSPRVVFVPGGSGMGKSALLDEACARLASREDVWLLRSRCFESEQVPFKAFDGALDTLCNYLRQLPDELVARLLPPDVELLARLFPSLNRIGLVEHLGEEAPELPEQGVGRSRAFACLAELLRRLSESGRVVLVLDDLQWMDIDSVRLLMALLTARKPVPFLLVGAYRSESQSRELAAFLGGLADVGVAPSQVPVEPLPRDVTMRLMGRVADRASELELERMAEDAGGSPHYAVQLAFSHREGAESVGRGLDDLLFDQVRALPESARSLLQAICVSPVPVRRSILFAAVRIQVRSPGLLAGLRQARLIRILDAGGDPRLGPYHDRVQQSVRRHLEPAKLEALHRALVDEWLKQPDPDPEVVLTHLLGSGRKEEAAPFARKAALQARRNHAFDRAAGRYELALELLGEDNPDRLELTVEMAEALGAAGHGTRAADAFLAAAALASGPERTSYRYAAARLLLESRIDTTELLLDVLRERGMGVRSRAGRAALLKLSGKRSIFSRELDSYVLPTEQRSSAVLDRFDAYLTSAVGLTFGGDLPLCSYFFLEVTKLGRDSGEPGRIAISAALDVTLLGRTRGISRARVKDRITEARAVLRACHQPWVIAHAHLLFAQTLSTFGRLKEGLAEFEEAERCFSALSPASGLAETASVSAAGLRLLVGDWSKTRVAAAHAVELGEARSQAFFRRAGHFLLLVIALADASPEKAELQLERLLERREGEAACWFDVVAETLRACVDVLRGRPGEHLRDLDAAERNLRSGLARREHRPFILLGRAIASLAQSEAGGTDQPDLLRQVKKDSREIADSMGTPLLRPFGFVLLAAASLLSGETARVVPLLHQAQEEFSHQGAAVLSAIVRIHRGLLDEGTEGQEETRRAVAELRSHGLREPLALAGVLFPALGIARDELRRRRDESSPV